jgi:hypothetical protein
MNISLIWFGYYWHHVADGEYWTSGDENNDAEFELMYC